MSVLKSRIRLQQAQTEYTRGLITKDAFRKIAEECFAVLGETSQMAGSLGEGIQLGPADLPAVIGPPVIDSPIIPINLPLVAVGAMPVTKKKKAGKKNSAPSASTPPSVPAEATPDAGNA